MNLPVWICFRTQDLYVVKIPKGSLSQASLASSPSVLGPLYPTPKPPGMGHDAIAVVARRDLKEAGVHRSGK